MVNFAILYTAEQFAENAKTALLDSVIGMLTVFGALIILWGAIELFRFVFEKASAGKKKSAKDAGENTNEVIGVPVEAEVENESDEGELVAAISSALAVYLDVPQTSFRVVSFRKSSRNTNWNKGR